MGQAVQIAAPALEKLPGEHSSQLVEDSLPTKRPFEQGLQVEEPDVLENAPAEQTEQTVTEVAPGTELYVPGEHLKHSVDPSPAT